MDLNRYLVITSIKCTRKLTNQRQKIFILNTIGVRQFSHLCTLQYYILNSNLKISYYLCIKITDFAEMISSLYMF